jgi:cytochrome c556
MAKLLFIVLFMSLLLSSCVSQSEYDKLNTEKDAVSAERDNLKKELEEIKYGAPNLLSDGQKFFDANDFAQARTKFQTLVDKHPEMPESIKAREYLEKIDEEEAWYNASNSTEVSITQGYIDRYPRGKYILPARVRFEQLKILAMKNAFESATAQNTSSAWKQFLADYPDHPQAAEIRKNIIRLEVDEISGSRETGRMPSFTQSGYSSSSSSTVRIKNDTGCELVVRYSGPDAKMISIAAGGTETVYLSNGSYRIAATACGENYAGTESLSGDYHSSFYITTSRY